MVGSMGMSAKKSVRSYREVSCASARYRRDQLFCIVVLCHCGDSLRVKNHPYAKTAGSLARLGTKPDQCCSGCVRVDELSAHPPSPRLVIEGNLWNVQEEFKNHLTRFMITDSTGQAVMILCRRRGPGFVQGERARVRYVAYNHKLVEMDMLTGPYGAWHLRESSGENAYWLWVAIGLFSGLLAYFQFAKTRPGQTTER